MDKRIEKRYLKIKGNQKKLKDEIARKREELENLKAQEREIVGQTIISICNDNDMSFMDAIDIFSNDDLENDNKENEINGN